MKPTCEFESGDEKHVAVIGTTSGKRKDLPKTLSTEISNEEAEALSEFLKRVGYSDFRGLAKSDDEAYLMQAGAAKIAKSLAAAGFDPR